MVEPDTFMTVQEVAARLRVNQQTVRNWIDAGLLKGFRVGTRRVRVRESDVEAFLEGGGAEPGRLSSTGARLKQLERRVDELAAIVDELQARLRGRD